MGKNPSIYADLGPNAANDVPMTPLSFIERAAQVYPDHPAMIHRGETRSWSEEYARCRRLAHALAKRGIGAQDTVSIFAHNCPAHVEVYFGVPMAGAVISALNTRLDAAMLAFMLEHSETKLLFTDRQLAPVMKDALSRMKTKPIVIDIDESDGERLGEMDYEAFLKTVSPTTHGNGLPTNGRRSRSTILPAPRATPKGVVYHHRGAYLNAIGNALVWNMPSHPVYLWTLPMFHASGWCFHWTVAAMSGVNVVLRKVDAADIFALIERHGVTHFTAAPIVLNLLVHAPDEVKKSFGRTSA
ncbi:MAG: AMP-binding protein [Alphaproteobacteria bacterium]